MREVAALSRPVCVGVIYSRPGLPLRIVRNKSCWLSLVKPIAVAAMVAGAVASQICAVAAVRWTLRLFLRLLG